jgi:hypothetical protein
VLSIHGVMPYLLLVSFYSGQINGFTTDKAMQITGSPFHGVAVQVVDYRKSAKNVDFEKATQRLKLTMRKDIWPWIFFNRFYGYRDHGSIPKGQEALFGNIRGMDLYNEAGALQDFFDTWKTALEMAKNLGSPGIVVDPEPYNCWDGSVLEFVATQRSELKEKVRERLVEIGGILADITAETYPDATLWFLFTAATVSVRRFPGRQDEFRTMTYIALGMLQRAVERKYAFKLVSGGEVIASLGYCFRDEKQLAEKIEARQGKFKPLLDKYPNLRLGGTISPWHDRKLKTTWMLKGECQKSTLENIDDFRPLFKTLLNSYAYVWVYAAGASGFNPYAPTVSRIYNKVISDELQDISRHIMTGEVSPATTPASLRRKGSSNSDQGEANP